MQKSHTQLVVLYDNNKADFAAKWAAKTDVCMREHIGGSRFSFSSDVAAVQVERKELVAHLRTKFLTHAQGSYVFPAMTCCLIDFPDAHIFVAMNCRYSTVLKSTARS